MARIELTTRVSAPPERCFDLARSVDLHAHAAAATGERAVAGVTRGLLGPGQEVTWRARISWSLCSLAGALGDTG